MPLENRDGCLPFTEDMFDENGHKALYQDEIAIELPVILVDRGNCHFVVKVRNIQKTGAYVALVADTVVEQSEVMVMEDDGSGNTIEIPSFLIRYWAAQEIYKTSEEGTKIIMKFSIDHPFDEDGRVDLDLWFSTPFDLSIELLESLYQVLPLLNEHVNFNLRLMTETCNFCVTYR